MKIAFIGQKGIPVIAGGVERRVQEISTRMARLGHEVFVYARKDYTPREMRQFEGVRLIHLPFILTKSLSTISHTFLATMHALFQNYDVIHYQAPGPSSLSWLVKLFRPKVGLVATFNSRDAQHQKWGFFARFYLTLGEWIISRIPDKTIVVGEILKRYVEEKYKRPAVLINNGSAVKELSDARVEEIEKWNLERKKYFISVSRLIKHKGIHYLIRAFVNAQKKNLIPQNFKLVIVGDGAFTDEYVAYLKKISQSNRNIVFTGSQTKENLDYLYLHAYAFVQPSEAEGLSNALLEAMGYGLPSIVSDIPENTFPLNGYGLTFSSKDATDLEKKLVFSLDNKKTVQRLGQEAKEHVIQNYNWDKNADKTLELYGEVLAGKKKAREFSSVILPKKAN